ncbi:hypothetical protein COU79_05445 [Candidatus Peregrinibacteria bacterium CG10_big_fil_rev_8_21_14_0_10_54_7]|nr:MAG: hypothetical protein COU79_05445 [Candidatus Peregrinibacteria bacterium CG10_big_fil_rev_8_21_14_0_10_54_7]
MQTECKEERGEDLLHPQVYECTLTSMTLTDAQKRLTEEETEIVVDWSQALSGDFSSDIDQMIAWVSTYPNRRGMHVFLGARRHHPTGRKLQNALQALGCRVTNRSYQLV